MNRIIIENKLGHSVKALKLQFPEKKKKKSAWNSLEIDQDQNHPTYNSKGKNKNECLKLTTTACCHFWLLGRGSCSLSWKP